MHAKSSLPYGTPSARGRHSFVSASPALAPVAQAGHRGARPARAQAARLTASVRAAGVAVGSEMWGDARIPPRGGRASEDVPVRCQKLLLRSRPRQGPCRFAPVQLRPGRARSSGSLRRSSTRPANAASSLPAAKSAAPVAVTTLSGRSNVTTGKAIDMYSADFDHGRCVVERTSRVGCEPDVGGREQLADTLIVRPAAELDVILQPELDSEALHVRQCVAGAEKHCAPVRTSLAQEREGPQGVVDAVLGCDDPYVGEQMLTSLLQRWVRLGALEADGSGAFRTMNTSSAAFPPRSMAIRR